MKQMILTVIESDHRHLTSDSFSQKGYLISQTVTILILYVVE